jgi:hypothetical protein
MTTDRGRFMRFCGVLRRRGILWFACLLVIGLPLAALAQRGGLFGGGGRFGLLPNVEYDGRFTVARVRYARNNSWSADYPTMEQHLSQMLDNITAIETHIEGSNVHFLDDPEFLRIPLSYLTEPG